ncbi:hypothetical protein J4573_52180 [Actinomadura barringtoniae]|uniref:Secreted protein n=1 Tax=Actinomadura barringtoniae TaxID=1427535 RepID=A0A939PVQ9_9ACTN|nr:hypothetical protein [Actinomadura barringtoniae]MBO2455716.1 hypothetical protein [Actinomadura barringtoniae]
MKKTKVIAAAASVAFAGGLMAVTPAASAASSTTKCHNTDSKNYKNFDLPGKTDIVGEGRTCITKYSDGRLTATIRFQWSEATLPAVGSGHKFDKFNINVRLDRRPNGSTSDIALAKRTCDVTSDVNADWSGETACGISVPDAYNSSFDFSTDGSLTYNIDNDGDGDSTFQLYGSPLVK